MSKTLAEFAEFVAKIAMASPARPGLHPFAVVIKREIYPPEVLMFETLIDAVIAYETLSVQWTESYLFATLKGPII